MSPARILGLIAMLGLASGPAYAQDPAAPPQAVQAPSAQAPAVQVPAGQSESTGPVVVQSGDPVQRKDEVGLDKARAAAKADEAVEDVERARDAARKADPRLLGIERSRDAARTSDGSGGKDCLSAREARGAITAKQAVPLVQAVRAAREAWDGEVIDYRLCTFDGALGYDLTLLNTDGRVARVRVDAANGKLVGVR